MLRLTILTEVKDHQPHELPTAYRGDLQALKGYAKRNGYQWKPVPGSLFGGYFAHPETGNVLYICSDR